MKNKMNITQWAQLNEMSPEEFIHEIVLTMASIGSMDLETQKENNTAIYKCGSGKFNYQVMVRRIDND